MKVSVQPPVITPEIIQGVQEWLRKNPNQRYPEPIPENLVVPVVPSGPFVYAGYDEPSPEETVRIEWLCFKRVPYFDHGRITWQKVARDQYGRDISV